VKEDLNDEHTDDQTRDEADGLHVGEEAKDDECDDDYQGDAEPDWRKGY
jgi:hypothetical protein